MKTCSKCKLSKSKVEFAKRSSKKDGLRSQCKACDQEYRNNNQDAVREYHYQNRYGISLEQYNNKLQAQNYCCDICGSSHVENQRMKTLVVDHCHTTGQVRGLLCHSCNIAIGAVKEKEEILMACISYLRSYNKE